MAEAEVEAVEAEAEEVPWEFRDAKGIENFAQNSPFFILLVSGLFFLLLLLVLLLLSLLFLLPLLSLLADVDVDVVVAKLMLLLQS